MPKARNCIHTSNQYPRNKTMLVKINFNGNEKEMEAEVDPHSFYTILKECPADVHLEEEVKIALDDGKREEKGRVIRGPIYINGRKTAGQIVYAGTFPNTVIGWKQLHDLDERIDTTDLGFVTHVPPVLIKGVRDPNYVQQPYLNDYLLDDAIRVIASWVRKGLIKRCDSVCNSHISLGRKPNGKVKINFYFSNLNRFSENEPPHPREDIPRTTEAITLGKYYSVFKLFFGEWQIPLDTYTKYKTAFTFLGKQYVWNRLPGDYQNKNSRLCNALQEVVDKLPYNMSKRVTIYVDTVLISADTQEECSRFTEDLQMQLENNSFEIRHSQSQTCKPKVVFIGKEINEDGVALSKKFQKTVKNLKSPTRIRELRSILGYLNDAREYTPGYGILSSHLSKLIGIREFSWDDENEDCLERLKNQVLVKRYLVPGLAENEACTIQIFVKEEAWMAQILNGAGKTYRFWSGVFETFKKDNCAILELKAMKEIWKKYEKILESRDVEWEVESPDIERYKDDIGRVTNGKPLKLDFLKSPRCKIKVVPADARQPPTSWEQIL